MAVDIHAYLEAHSRYQGLRDAAFHMAWDVWKDRLPREADLKILPAYSGDANSKRFWELLWQVVEAPELHYPWDRIFEQIWKTPRRLDVAIWSGPILCGLVAGMASRGPDNVTLRFIERWPGDRNPLRGRIAPIAIDIADMYAKVLGKQWVKIKEPAPQAIPRYESLGFSLAPSVKGRKYWRRYVE